MQREIILLFPFQFLKGFYLFAKLLWLEHLLLEVKSGHLCYVPDLEGKLGLSPFSSMFTVGFSCGLCYVEIVYFCFCCMSLLYVFIMKVIEFVRCYSFWPSVGWSCAVFFLHYINVVYYIDFHLNHLCITGIYNPLSWCIFSEYCWNSFASICWRIYPSVDQAWCVGVFVCLFVCLWVSEFFSSYLIFGKVWGKLVLVTL